MSTDVSAGEDACVHKGLGPDKDDKNSENTPTRDNDSLLCTSLVSEQEEEGNGEDWWSPKVDDGSKVGRWMGFCVALRGCM